MRALFGSCARQRGQGLQCTPHGTAGGRPTAVTLGKTSWRPCQGASEKRSHGPWGRRNSALVPFDTRAPPFRIATDMRPQAPKAQGVGLHGRRTNNERSADMCAPNLAHPPLRCRRMRTAAAMRVCCVQGSAAPQTGTRCVHDGDTTATQRTMNIPTPHTPHTRPLLRGGGVRATPSPGPWLGAGASPAGQSTQWDWAPPLGPLGRTQPHPLQGGGNFSAGRNLSGKI